MVNLGNHCSDEYMHKYIYKEMNKSVTLCKMCAQQQSPLFRLPVSNMSVMRVSRMSTKMSTYLYTSSHQKRGEIFQVTHLLGEKILF